MINNFKTCLNVTQNCKVMLSHKVQNEKNGGGFLAMLNKKQLNVVMNDDFSDKTQKSFFQHDFLYSHIDKCCCKWLLKIFLNKWENKMQHIIPKRTSSLTSRATHFPSAYTIL